MTLSIITESGLYWDGEREKLIAGWPDTADRAVHTAEAVMSGTASRNRDKGPFSTW